MSTYKGIDFSQDGGVDSGKEHSVGFGPTYNCKYITSDGKIMFETNIMAGSEDAAKVKFRNYRMGYSDRSCKVVITELKRSAQ